jgi:hypothetical protein
MLAGRGLRRHARRLRRVQTDDLRRLALIAVALAALVVAGPASASAQRPIPDTSAVIAVWNDQLPDSMTPAQIRFVASHVDGTQKVSLATARALRAFNPGFLVLHYRLGIGDGPVPFRIGTRWASDYGQVSRHGSWFWHLGGRRVLNTEWDWYLMNPDSGWSSYWAGRVMYEARLLGDDGVFADSLSVPQYLGASSFSPPLRYFVGEAAWTARIDRFMRYQERRLHGRLWFIPNAGSWITTRDRTDYALADGVMIEGFAEAGPLSSYAPGDWRLEMDRALGLIRRGKTVIAQSYLDASDMRARMFVLGSYLLIKGSHTFINMDVGLVPQWFPEYGLDLGLALGPLPPRVESLRVAGGLYVRRFARGIVAVNPGGSPSRLALAAPMQLVTPVGGGELDGSADTHGWSLRLTTLTGSVPVPAHGAVVLLG